MVVALLAAAFELADDLLFPFQNLVAGLERLFVDAELTLREIADVADRGLDHVVLPDEFVDRLGFRGRLDDDEVLGHCGTPQTSRRMPIFRSPAIRPGPIKWSWRGNELEVAEVSTRIWTFRLRPLRPRRPCRRSCTFSSCCRASCRRCRGSRRSCGGRRRSSAGSLR